MRKPLVVVVVLWMAAGLLFPKMAVSAHPEAATAYQIVDAVNALRSSYGLAPYSINSILMGTAQAQADFMAATGTVTHSGPGGTTVTQRLLAAGYPLAGDLSLGGFRSENITSDSPDASAESIVASWTTDDLHLNTMVSPSLLEIGAGVAISNGRAYYVIDCARPTGSGAPQATLPESATGDGAVGTPAFSIPTVVVSTPKEDGSLTHVVQAGETLWSIAAAYGVPVEQLQSLNQLGSSTLIYPGATLIIRNPATSTPSPAVATRTVLPSFTPYIPRTATPTDFPAAAVTPQAPLTGQDTTMIVVVIIFVALIFAGVMTAASSRRKIE
jgi:LysM repeat protein